MFERTLHKVVFEINLISCSLLCFSSTKFFIGVL